MADTPTARDADAPFCPGADDNNPPDVIIQSSDSVHFHVHWAILAFSSPFFKHMQAFPTPTGSNANPTRDGKPIIMLPEPSTVLGKLLLLCYPRLSASFAFRDLDGVDGAYEAAKKYDITGGLSQIHAVLLDPRFLLQHPHRIFAIACHQGLEDIAKAAALETLKQPTSIFDKHNPPPPEYRLMSAHQLWLLELFHKECGTALAEKLSTYSQSVPSERMNSLLFVLHQGFIWQQPMSCRHADGCGPRVDGEQALPARWFAVHIQRCAEACRKQPSAETVARLVPAISGDTLKSIAGCPCCFSSALPALTDLGAKIAREASDILKQKAAEMQFTS
ncbi:hypothetical protein C8F01DRAFT_1362295 [Mycena amicta]|nr:hypothetical protein C8F01DRAFT_1362295 [Mycena amicta]